MHPIKIHAGDFHGKGAYGSGWAETPGVLLLPCEAHPLGERILDTELASIELATEETVTGLGGAVGWGLVGGALLGPVGLLAGLLRGGQKRQITFIAQFKDGRKMLATTDRETFAKLQAAAF